MTEVLNYLVLKEGTDYEILSHPYDHIIRQTKMTNYKVENFVN